MNQPIVDAEFEELDTSAPLEEVTPHLYEIVTVFRVAVVSFGAALPRVIGINLPYVWIFSTVGVVMAFLMARLLLGTQSPVYVWGRYIIIAVIFFPAIFVGLVVNGFLRAASFIREQGNAEQDFRNEKRRFYKNANRRFEN